MFRAEIWVTHSPCSSCWMPKAIREAIGEVRNDERSDLEMFASLLVPLGKKCCGSLEIFGSKIPLNESEREEK